MNLDDSKMILDDFKMIYDDSRLELMLNALNCDRLFQMVLDDLKSIKSDGFRTVTD